MQNKHRTTNNEKLNFEGSSASLHVIGVNESYGMIRVYSAVGFFSSETTKQFSIQHPNEKQNIHAGTNDDDHWYNNLS